MSKPKIAVSLLCQWYEIAILNEYIDSLNKAISKYDGKIFLDFCLNINQDLEKIHRGTLGEIVDRYNEITDILLKNDNVSYNFWLNKDKPIGIGEFRRNSNIKCAHDHDIIIWGETDALVPSVTFELISILNNKCYENKVDQWCAFFATNKMWDKSWELIEHKAFRDKPFDPDSKENIWDLCHVVTYEEMEEINNVPFIDIDRVWPPQFNGCQLILSSSIIRNGINIPESMFFMREDTALMQEFRRHPEIHQYVFSNIYGPHNRKHPYKRTNILGEESIEDKSKIGQLRGCHDWYARAEKIMDMNLANLYNPNYKPGTWDNICLE